MRFNCISKLATGGGTLGFGMEWQNIPECTVPMLLVYKIANALVSFPKGMQIKVKGERIEI
ncbi:MAG: hypothetical protein ACTS85_03245 [Arsenophonus sp. NC-PG7-MAG3]